MMIQPSDGQEPLDLEILVSEEEKSVYVKFAGFETLEDADEYAEFLVDMLPLLLNNPGTKH